MQPGDKPRIAIIGGGLAGALLACYLGRRDYDVDLYERRPDPESEPFVGGRSINLAISERGLHALERVGLADAVLRQAIPMRGRMIHGLRGDLHFQPYDKDPSRCINSVSRVALNSLTIAAARRHPRVRVHFEHRCTDVDLERPAIELLDLRSRQPLRVEHDLVFGVDGAYSAVRGAMQRRERFDYSQHYLLHGYKELSIPPGPTGAHRMERNALHIWPRRSFMMIALPNPDGSFTCTLFLPWGDPGHPQGWPPARSPGAGSSLPRVRLRRPAGDASGPSGPADNLGFAFLRSDDEVLRFFHRWFPDAVPLMPTLLEDFRRHPTGSMVTIRCAPWHWAGRVALVGDAAHAVVPFYGQGANAAFEDCVVLDECIDRHAPDWERILAEYDRLRRPHVDALADLALANFIEMRDKTASRAFRIYKATDRTLHRLLPRWYTPLYTMVSFTRIPYADAVRRARRQDRILAAGALIGVAALLTFALCTVARLALGSSVALSAIVVAAILLVAARRRAQERRELQAVGARDA